MVKDYFQDITPPTSGAPAPRQFTPPPSPKPPEEQDAFSDEAQQVPIRVGGQSDGGAPITPDPARGIRNIPAPTRVRPRLDPDMRQPGSPAFGAVPPRPPRSFRHMWIWLLAGLSILVVGSLSLFIFRATTVTITPKSQAALFSGTAPLIARAADDTGVGGLVYTIQISDLEDSEVVPAQGTTHVETKASGSVTVYNTYSATSVRLVKNTRFETPDGLIFRAPADVVVPGKSGATPGQVRITVVADQPGEKYNVAAVSKFTLPGLKSTAAMYAGVHAKSDVPMTGGFSGEQPGTAPGALEAAIAQVRTRLEAKAHEAALAQAGDEKMIFPELMAITYQSMPNTTEAGGGVRIHEKAHVEVPVFSAEPFAQAMAEAAGANAESSPLVFNPGSDFSVQAASSTGTIGQILTFSVAGGGTIVWKVDAAAIAAALAGRDSGAFESIVNGFASVAEAKARIEPFWKNSFPTDASKIKVVVIEPEAVR